MKIADLYNKTNKPIFSIEVLPPRNGTDEAVLFEIIKEVIPYNIPFISITMGSDLSLRGGSLALASLIKSKMNIEVLAHCTCVRRSKEEIENLLTEYRYLGLDNILALRGDPPIGEETFKPHCQGHEYAKEMIRQINHMNRGKYLQRKTDTAYAGKEGYFRSGIKTDFCIGVAGHPDGHPECQGYEENFMYLKEKQDEGAKFIITQAFYSIDIYERFLEGAHRHGVTIPIIPGVMPVVNVKNLQMVQKLFKVKVPKDLLKVFEKYFHDPISFKEAGLDYTVSFCQKLLQLPVKGIQFFTLNKKGIVPKIISQI